MGNILGKYRDAGDSANIVAEEIATQRDTRQSPVPSVSLVGASILLIFHKADKQSRLLEEAARKHGCRCKLLLFRSGYTALLELSKTLDQVIDLVIIDRRRQIINNSKELQTVASQYDARSADVIRQELFEIPEFREAMVAALIPLKSAEKRVALVTSTFEAGYNKCITEFTCVEDAERELLSFLYSELPLLRRCRKLPLLSRISYRTAEPNECRALSLPKPVYALASEQSKSLESSHVSPNITVSSTVTEVLRPSQATIRSSRFEKFPLDLPEPRTGDSQNRDKRSKSLGALRTKRNARQTWGGNPPTVFDRETLDKLIGGRLRDSTFISMNINTASPLFKVVAILLATKQRSPTGVSKDLQKAIDIICESDAFVGQLFKPASVNQDPLTADLMEGLMVTTTGLKEVPFGHNSVSAAHHEEGHLQSEVHSGGVAMTEEIKQCLIGDDRWDYDILALERLTQNRPMTYLAMKVFARFNLFKTLRVSESVVSSWLEVIQEHYRARNSYHNATHASDVLQSTAYLMRREPFSNIFDNMEEVSSLLAAVVHDLDHPGRTNPFLVNSNSELAILYNDIAVLENHHVALAFELTRKDPSINIFQNLSRTEYRTIRGYVVDMVLATEMARHFDHVANFVNNVSKPLSRKTEQSSVGSMSSVESGGIVLSSSTSQLTGSLTGTEETPESPSERLAKPEIRGIIRRMIIKCSDVNNQTRPFRICREWALRIAEEYFSQTEEEKQLDLPIVMPSFDRQTCNIPKSQLSFIDFFLRDMFSAFDAVCPIPELMENLETNYATWKRASEKESFEFAESRF